MSKFFQTDFWYSSSFGVTWPSNFGRVGNFKWWYLWNMFDSTIGFSRMADWMELLLVTPNLRWRLYAIFEMQIIISVQFVVQSTVNIHPHSASCHLQTHGVPLVSNDSATHKDSAVLSVGPGRGPPSFGGPKQMCVIFFILWNKA